VSDSGVGRLGGLHVGGKVHNNGDRTGALTLSALGVPAGDDVRDGDGVCCLFMEDIVKAVVLRSSWGPRAEGVHLDSRPRTDSKP